MPLQFPAEGNEFVPRAKARAQAGWIDDIVTAGIIRLSAKNRGGIHVADPQPVQIRHQVGGFAKPKAAAKLKPVCRGRYPQFSWLKPRGSLPNAGTVAPTHPPARPRRR